jgi:hypothetical protein
MIMITCLVLVLNKKSEASYLITLFVYAAVTILTTLFALNETGFNVSYSASEPYHIYMTTLLDISGVMACALIPLQCMKFSSLRARKRYVNWILLPCIAYSILLSFWRCSIWGSPCAFCSATIISSDCPRSAPPS